MVETTDVLVPVRPRPVWTNLRRSQAGREAGWGLVFIAPWLIGLVLFVGGPIVASLVLSLTDFDLVHPENVRFVGLDNYARLASDPTVARSVGATFKFALLVIPLTMLASLGFALLMNSPQLF